MLSKNKKFKTASGAAGGAVVTSSAADRSTVDLRESLRASKELNRSYTFLDAGLYSSSIMKNILSGSTVETPAIDHVSSSDAG